MIELKEIRNSILVNERVVVSLKDTGDYIMNFTDNARSKEN